MRLIDADKLKMAIKKRVNLCENSLTVGELSILTKSILSIDHMPTVDAVPVVSGRWEVADWVEPDGHGFECIRTPKAGMRCNQCAHVFKRKLLWRDNYCPNCGAKMDLRDGDEDA